MGNALFASMCLFSDYAGNNVIVLAILGKGLHVRSHIYIYIYIYIYVYYMYSALAEFLCVQNITR